MRAPTRLRSGRATDGDIFRQQGRHKWSPSRALSQSRELRHELRNTQATRAHNWLTPDRRPNQLPADTRQPSQPAFANTSQATDAPDRQTHKPAHPSSGGSTAPTSRRMLEPLEVASRLQGYKSFAQAWRCVSFGCTLLALVLLASKWYEVSTDLSLLMGIEQLLSLAASSAQQATSNQSVAPASSTLSWPPVPLEQLLPAMNESSLGMESLDSNSTMLMSHMRMSLSRELNGDQLLRQEVGAFVGEIRGARSTLALSSLLVAVYLVSWLLMISAINDTRISVSTSNSSGERASLRPSPPPPPPPHQQVSAGVGRPARRPAGSLAGPPRSEGPQSPSCNHDYHYGLEAKRRADQSAAGSASAAALLANYQLRNNRRRSRANKLARHPLRLASRPAAGWWDRSGSLIFGARTLIRVRATKGWPDE